MEAGKRDIFALEAHSATNDCVTVRQGAEEHGHLAAAQVLEHLLPVSVVTNL